MPESVGPESFNAAQVGLVILTLAALASLVAAVQQGLLGHPDMQIAGNGSTSFLLNWYADRVGPAPTRAWVVSVPLLAYRLLMLAWALWLSFAMLRWLRWGRACFSTHGLWRSALSGTFLPCLRPPSSPTPAEELPPLRGEQRSIPAVRQARTARASCGPDGTAECGKPTPITAIGAVNNAPWKSLSINLQLT